MANVKITELVELAAVDIAVNDVLPIVDVSADATKKVTIVSLRNYADANDYITYTTLNSSINNTQSNVNTVQSNIIAYATQANINLDTKANVSATYFAALANDYATYTVLVGSIANTNAYITTNYSTLLQLNTVQDNVTSLTTSTNTIRANVDSVQSNVGTLTTSTNTIKANVDSVQANVVNITNGTTAFTGNITVNRDLTISGNLVVGGATSTILTTDTVLKDRVITLSNGAASASFDTGLYLSRGTSGNVFVGFDESAKQFVAAYTDDAASNAVTDFTIASYANVRFNTITADGLINNVDVANVPTNINTVQSNVTSLTTSTNTIQSNVNSVQSNVGTLTTSVNTIQSNVNSVQSNVTTLTTNVNLVQSNVANITNGTTAFTGVTTTFNKNVVISGNVTIGTNTSNTLTIVGSIDLGELG
jgi:archaellum component FlaC